MSASIHTETIGYITIREEDCDRVVDIWQSDKSNTMSTVFDDYIRVETILDIKSLVPTFVSENDYNDLVNYCDVAHLLLEV